MAAIGRSVSGAAASLDWEVRQQASVESAAHEAAARAHRLAERLTGLGRYTSQKAQSLEVADQAEAGGGHSQARGVIQRLMDAWHRSVGEVKHELQVLLGLGRVIAPTVLPLPVLEGLDWLRRMRPDLFKRAPSTSQPKTPPPDSASAPQDRPAPDPQESPSPHPRPAEVRPQEPAPPSVEAPTVRPQYDDHGEPIPLPGTTDTHINLEIDAPIQNRPGQRSADAYNSVLDQFGVQANPRYAERGGNTYCNVFVRDATRAMGCEIPPNKAEDMTRWLQQQGPANGWKEVSPDEAQRLANEGKPAVAAYLGNDSEPGHVAMIRPRQEGDTTAIVIAQAGAKNDNYMPLREGFGSREVHFFVHD